MAARTFQFRLSSEGAQQVIADLKGLAANSNEAERALRALTQASPQLASIQDGVTQKVRATAAAMKDAADSTGRFQTVLSGLSGAGIGGNLGGAFLSGGAFGAGLELARLGLEKVKAGIEAIPKAGDEARQAMGRLTASIGDSGGAASAFERLQQLARQTGVSVVESAGAFVRFNVAARDIGATQDQVLKLVEGIQKFGIVSGASQAEIAAGTTQLAQALASGRLQGDELRSILENMPVLAQALARELGTSVGNLRQMGTDGKLTADTVFPALLRAAEGIDAKFAAMPVTIARATGALTAATDAFFASIDKSLGLSEKLIASLQTAAGIVNAVRRGLGFATDAERLVNLQAKVPDLQAQADDIDARIGTVRPSGVSTTGATPGEIENLRKARDAITKQIADANAEIQQIQRIAREDQRADAETAGRQRLDAQRSQSEREIVTLKESLDKKFKAQKEYDDRIKQLTTARDRGAISGTEFDQLSGLAGTKLAEALKDSASKVKAAGADAGQALEETLQKLRETMEKEADAAERALDPAVAAVENYEKRLRAITGGVDSGKFSDARGQELMGLNLEKFSGELQKADASATEATDSFGKFFANATSGFENAIVSGGKFSDILKGIEQDIARLIIRQALLKPLTDAVDKLGIGGWIKGALGIGGAAATSSISLGSGASSFTSPEFPLGGLYAMGGVHSSRGPVPLRRYAGGGVANSPQMAMFGEGSLPEAYVPLQDGRSIPVTMRGGAVTYRGGDVHVHLGNSTASPEFIGAVVNLARSQSRQDMLNEVNRGGSFAKQFGRRRT